MRAPWTCVHAHMCAEAPTQWSPDHSALCLGADANCQLRPGPLLAFAWGAVLMRLLSLPVPLKSSTSRGDFRGPRALGLSKLLWMPSFVPLAVPRWPPSGAAAPCPFPQACRWAVLRVRGGSSCPSTSVQRRLAAGSLALPASSPEKSSSCLAGRASTRSALGAVCWFSTTATIEESGKTRLIWGVLC